MINRVCIVEDAEYKRRDLEEAMNTIVPDAEVVFAKDYRSGSRLVKRDEWDLILLDMELPLFCSGTNSHFALGGERILNQLQRRSKGSPVIVVTQYTTFSEYLEEVDFESLVSRLSAACPDVFIGAVQYAIGNDGWHEDLKDIIYNLNEDTNSR